ncbi:alpha-amylase [Colwellia sp. D2M02]|uniref:alpha-amylase family glycosyl hydrolase n=1 Tax=Colwellia sp. D2M02 TaxID=2841562 RepID=UPI001C07F673|nr:alpha-amylase family glycosyl hydrolase [Colwellia sp. D2M02]MBU2893691.1 alpha-amylase [Colwellia sp. D2M02]
MKSNLAKIIRRVNPALSKAGLVLAFSFSVSALTLAANLTTDTSVDSSSNHNQLSVATSTLVAKAKDLRPYQERDFQDEVFYFVLPDRFYNGDAANDFGASLSDTQRALSRGGFDPTHKGMYHGGDLIGLTEKLPYLDNMGISAIWLTPILRNRAVQAGTSGYHGYWILDFTEIDPHLGSNAELKHFIDQAHQRNIKVFFDIITNHTADVIKYEECHGKAGNAWLVKGDDCPFKSSEQLAQGERYTPLIPLGEEAIKSPTWLNDLKYYHNQGDSFWQGESAVRGDFAGLDDLYTQHPQVVAGMIDIYKNIIDEFKPDGFRIDTVKHVNIEFWQAFSPALMQHAKAQGIKNFFMFGEVYSFEPELLSRFTTEAKIPSVLDFAFQGAMEKTLVQQQGTDVLAKLFAQDHLYQSNNSNANQLVNFTGNHDMGRFAYMLKNSPKNYSEAAQIERNLLAHAMMFFSRGVPVIYYGDEQGFVGDGGDQASRQDMMPSKVASYNDDDLLATDNSTADNNFDVSHPFYQRFSEYAALYQQYPALRFGQQEVVYAQDSAGIFAITRDYQVTENSDKKSQKLLVVFNTATQAQPLTKVMKQSDVQLIYRSVNSGSSDEIAALSFAIYQL